VKQAAEQVASAHGASVILARNGQPGERVWRTMHECPVRTAAVAMLAVDPKDLLQVATADDQQQSRHSARTVRTQRSAYAFAFGACTGVKSTSAPSERNTSSKLRGTDSPGGQSWAARARWAGHRGPDCSTASANAALVGRFGRLVTMLTSTLPIGRPQSIAPHGRTARRLQVTPVATRPGCDHCPRQPLVGRPVAACRPPLWVLIARADPKRWWQPTMEFVWDLFVFLVLVAVGLVVLNLLARTR
jgi:hypothetical protein